MFTTRFGLFTKRRGFGSANTNERMGNWMIYQPSQSPSESSIQFNKKLKPQRAINQMAFLGVLPIQYHANRFFVHRKLYDFIAINRKCRSRAGRAGRACACCALIVTVCHLSIYSSAVLSPSACHRCSRQLAAWCTMKIFCLHNLRFLSTDDCGSKCQRFLVETLRRE